MQLPDDEQVDSVAARQAEVRQTSSSLRSRRSPCSGRTSAPSKRGSPTAPSSTASAPFGGGERCGRQRFTGLVDGRAAEDVLVELEVERQLRRAGGRRSGLGADPVTGKECDLRSRAPWRRPPSRGDERRVHGEHALRIARGRR